MRTDDVIDMLNDLWTVKRALIDQYVARSKVRAARGDADLGERFSDFAFDQMREVSRMLDRIVALGGIPQLQPVDPVPVGAETADQLHHSKTAELALVPRLERAQALAEQAQDAETARLIEDIVRNAHERLGWLKETSARAAPTP